VNPPSVQLLRKADIFICIASIWARDIAKGLRKMGVRKYLDMTFWDQRLRKNFDKDKIKKSVKFIKAAIRLFSDVESKKVFRALINYRLSMDPVNLRTSSYEQYNHPKVGPRRNDVIIDAGAFTGDSAIQFCKQLQNKCTIFSFEPGENNCKIMKNNLKSEGMQNKVFTIKAALWRENSMLKINTRVASDSFFLCDTGNTNIHAISIDSFIKKRKIVPDLIKMDIEGAEYEAIEGASDTIRIYGPKLQISLYHKLSDLWKIPLLIKKLNSKYRLYLGHHTQSLAESVLYATIN